MQASQTFPSAINLYKHHKLEQESQICWLLLKLRWSISSWGMITQRDLLKPLTYKSLRDPDAILKLQILVLLHWLALSNHLMVMLQMSGDLTDDRSTLVQVMAWCRQATSHYLSPCWTRSRPQWVKSQPCPYIIISLIFDSYHHSWTRLTHLRMENYNKFLSMWEVNNFSFIHSLIYWSIHLFHWFIHLFFIKY